VPVVHIRGSIGRANDCTRRKVVAIELEVVPFDREVVQYDIMVVAHVLEIVSSGRAAVANTLRIFLSGLVPRRTRFGRFRSV
jgi:hypothetical protein